MNEDITKSLSEIEIAELSQACHEVLTQHGMLLLRRLLFQFDRYKSALQEISYHSVCCDARHVSDRALKD